MGLPLEEGEGDSPSFDSVKITSGDGDTSEAVASEVPVGEAAEAAGTTEPDPQSSNHKDTETQSEPLKEDRSDA